MRANPYMVTLGVIAGLAAFIGLIVLLVAGGAGVLWGTVLLGFGAFALFALLVAGAIRWTPPPASDEPPAS